MFFVNFAKKNVVTPHLNRLLETVHMGGNTVWSQWEIRKVIIKYFLQSRALGWTFLWLNISFYYLFYPPKSMKSIALESSHYSHRDVSNEIKSHVLWWRNYQRSRIILREIFFLQNVIHIWSVYLGVTTCCYEKKGKIIPNYLCFPTFIGIIGGYKRDH